MSRKLKFCAIMSIHFSTYIPRTRHEDFDCPGHKLYSYFEKRLMYLMFHLQLPIHRLWLLLALSPQEIMLKEICPVSFWNLSHCSVFEGMDRNYDLCKTSLNPSHVEHAKTVEDCHLECEVFQNLDKYIAVGYNINSIWFHCARWKTQ